MVGGADALSAFIGEALMHYYANLQLHSREDLKGAPKETFLVVVTKHNSRLEVGEVFPAELLPAGVTAVAPIRIDELVECGAEGETPATVDVFADAYVEHPDGFEALMRAFADADWQSYMGAREQ